MTKSKQEAVVTIPKPEIKTIEIHIKGTNSLIMHKWSEKAKREMLAKQQKKASKGKEPKDPQADFEAAIYRFPDGRYCFPSVAFKCAAVRAAKQCEIAMTDARVFFHVEGVNDREMVEIKTADPVMREDIVRLQGNTADLRYRPEFKDWEATLKIRFNARSISEEQIMNLFQIAGFSVGIGEWRPERNGQYGTFEIV